MKAKKKILQLKILTEKIPAVKVLPKKIPEVENPIEKIFFSVENPYKKIPVAKNIHKNKKKKLKKKREKCFEQKKPRIKIFGAKNFQKKIPEV